MASTYRIAESAAESLYEDERLRSNLTDREASIVLKWATDWLSESVNALGDDALAQSVAQSEIARVRTALVAFNALGKQSNAPRLGAAFNAAREALSGTPHLASAVRVLEPMLASGQPFTREEIFSLLTTLVRAAWQLRSS